MAHDIFGERFLSHREPAWHKLGLVVEEQLTATEAFSKIGAYDVIKEDIYSTRGEKISGFKSLTRHSTEGIKTLGVVSDDYSILTPHDVVEIFDRAVGKFVETIGVLKEGGLIFVTTKLDEYDIRGDQNINYLLVANPMNGKEAAEIGVSPIRTVCANTLKIAKARSSESYKLFHLGDIKGEFEKWLAWAFKRVDLKTEEIKTHFNKLALTYPDATYINEVLQFAYPSPKEVSDDLPPSVKSVKIEVNASLEKTAIKKREIVQQLYGGAGVGQGLVSCKDTAYGLYNAVVEAEDYTGTIGEWSRANSAVFGTRAKIKERAFEKCLELSQI